MIGWAKQSEVKPEDWKTARGCWGADNKWQTSRWPSVTPSFWEKEFDVIAESQIFLCSGVTEESASLQTSHNFICVSMSEQPDWTQRVGGVFFIYFLVQVDHIFMSYTIGQDCSKQIISTLGERGRYREKIWLVLFSLYQKKWMTPRWSANESIGINVEDIQMWPELFGCDSLANYCAHALVASNGCISTLNWERPTETHQ